MAQVLDQFGHRRRTGADAAGDHRGRTALDRRQEGLVRSLERVRQALRHVGANVEACVVFVTLRVRKSISTTPEAYSMLHPALALLGATRRGELGVAVVGEVQFGRKPDQAGACGGEARAIRRP